MTWITNYCLNLHWEVKDSSFFSLWVYLVPLEHQFFDLALKSPIIIMLTTGFRFAILSSNNFKFVKNVSNSFDDRLGDR